MFKTFLDESGLEEQQHQVEGVEWCLKKETNTTTKTRGGIIADEMGLGKTIQLVGTMYANNLPHTLIVLPKALLDQWVHVIKKMLKQKPLIYHGIWKKQTTLEHLHTYPIVITTYGMIATDGMIATETDRKQKEPSLLHDINWDRIIFDEAHHMRNNQTKIYKGANKLKSDIKWFVTGTPIQNRRNDLYSLCALLGLEAAYYTKPSNMPELCEKYILRRTKESTGLAETMPKLNIYTITIPWTNSYEFNLSEDIHSTLKFSHVNKEKVYYTTPGCLLGEYTLVSLLRARQLCILPLLLIEKYEKYQAQVQEHTTQHQHKEIQAALSSSSKLDYVLDHILKRKSNGKAKLIFCHFRGEIDFIHNLLKSHNLNTETFDGRTNEKKRNAILTNTKLDVLILQLQTGCEGLNLQHFSEVYFISPHWNPAIEDQAIARCHRFGQKKEVDVFRFYMAGFDTMSETNSIDEHSANIQKSKRILMELIED